MQIVVNSIAVSWSPQKRKLCQKQMQLRNFSEKAILCMYFIWCIVTLMTDVGFELLWEI